MFLEKPEAQARYDICKACPLFDSTTFTCKKCGCFMKIKVKFAVFKCPEGKWS